MIFLLAAKLADEGIDWFIRVFSFNSIFYLTFIFYPHIVYSIDKIKCLWKSPAWKRQSFIWISRLDIAEMKCWASLLSLNLLRQSPPSNLKLPWASYQCLHIEKKGACHTSAEKIHLPAWRQWRRSPFEIPVSAWILPHIMHLIDQRSRNRRQDELSVGGANVTLRLFHSVWFPLLAPIQYESIASEIQIRSERSLLQCVRLS